MAAPTADPGSFRDPLSRVFIDGDRVIRALSTEASRDFDATERSDFFTEAVSRGRVIQTERVSLEPSDFDQQERWESALEHPRLPIWTYPYEWPFSMLREAALLQLELQSDGLRDDISCKDATPYNIQFVGSAPVFVDVGSFEQYLDGDPWYGYLQFCQLFLFPLLLQSYADVPFQPLLRGSLEGIAPDLAWALLGPSKLHKRGVPIHVALHARAQRRYADTDTDMKAALKKGGYRRSLLEANVKGLHRLVSRLEWKRAESTWSDYGERAHYTSQDLAEKERFVNEAASRRRHHLAWDVGCNDGRFSRLIAPHVDHVVAFDGDHLVVDHLYRALRNERLSNITPLVMDLGDPSPGLGWANRERPPFIERCRPDFVLALAVIHHLAITANVPTSFFLDLVRSFDASAVIEFPTEHDPMVKRLLRNKRQGVHAGYTLADFESQLAERFHVRERLTLDSRELFEVEPR
jgi:hypothetical protein